MEQYILGKKLISNSDIVRKLAILIKKSINIIDLFKFYKYSLDGHPKNICCPFHGDNVPSSRIINHDIAFKCYAGCGKFDVLGFVKKAEGFETYGEVIAFIDDKFALGLGKSDLLDIKLSVAMEESKQIRVKRETIVQFRDMVNVILRHIDYMFDKLGWQEPKAFWYHIWEDIWECFDNEVWKYVNNDIDLALKNLYIWLEATYDRVLWLKICLEDLIEEDEEEDIGW